MTDSAVILLVVCILWTIFGALFFVYVSIQLNKIEDNINGLHKLTNQLLDAIIEEEEDNSQRLKEKIERFDNKMQALKDGTT